MSFKKNKYQVIKKALSPEMTYFCSRYFSFKRQVADTLFKSKFISPYETMFGVWGDDQIPGSYCHYADLVMEVLLAELLPLMMKKTGLKLTPNYSYARIYKKGDELKRHKDRFSCEISTTLNLGGDPWPIFLEPSGKKGMKGAKINLKPGDMLVYRGCDLEHWREPFEGESCTQVFLHYNNLKTKKSNENLFDKRPHLGLPPSFKRK